MAKVIHTEDAPSAIGPYSQAVAIDLVNVSELVFTSGQIGLDPKTQEFAGTDVAAQATQVLDNLAAVLNAAGCTFADVLKATIYIVDLDDFATVNRLYAARFENDPPARSTVEVAALPKGAKVEIDLIAARQR